MSIANSQEEEVKVVMVDWVRFRNTYLQLPWLFPLVIGDRQFDAVLQSRPRNFIDKVQRALEKTLWFWPRVIDASIWAQGAPGKLQTPHNFAALDADAELLLGWVERVCPDRKAEILDIGCNCGRHLIELWRRGYRNLTGVDAMSSALTLFAETAPDVYSGADIHFDLFQRFLLRQPDRRFDLVYSHGATIELVHPSFDVVSHLCRVARTHICLLLSPNNVFRREWDWQFQRNGFTVVYSEVPIAPESDLSLIVLRRMTAS